MQSAITDLAGLRYWAHPGVDLHYVTHPESIEEVERLVGPGTVEWVRPPISPRVPDAAHPPRRPRGARRPGPRADGARLRRRLGDRRPRGRDRARRSSGDDTLVVCITGRNEVAREKLEQRFGDNEQVRVLGFTEQMSDWMAAADAMIHATAGLTVLEAHIRGCPVVSYGFSAGHLRANNAAFERFGLAEVARSDHELESVLRHVTRERRSPDSSFASLPSIASRALTVRPRVRPQPVWRLRAERVVAAAALAVDRGGPDALAGQPREPADRVIAKPIKSRIHIGKDNDTPATPPARAEAGGRRRPPKPAGDGRARPLDRGGAAGAGADRGRGRSTRARRWRRSCPRLGDGARGRAAPGGGRGRRPHLRRRPPPAGHPGGARDRCARPAPTATFFLAGEQVERRPALAAEIVAAGHRVELHCHRHRNQLRLDARGSCSTTPSGPGGDRGGERPGDRRLPPALRDLQRRRPAGDPRPRLAAGALVAVGEGLDAAGDAELDRAQGDRPASAPGDILLLHDADYYSAPRLLGAHRRGAADDPRGARGAGAEVEAAAPLSRRRERPLIAAGEGFVEPLRHRALGPVLVEDLLGHSSPSW